MPSNDAQKAVSPLAHSPLHCTALPWPTLRAPSAALFWPLVCRLPAARPLAVCATVAGEASAFSGDPSHGSIIPGRRPG